MILEYMAKGNLQNYLRENRSTNGATYTNLHKHSKTLTERDLIKFALDVAMGMEFLSTKQVGFKLTTMLVFTYGILSNIVHLGRDNKSDLYI